MRTLPKILYFLCFLALALGAALALNRIVSPSITGLLVRAVLSAAIAATPGLIYRKAWPLTIILLPLAAYLLLRTSIPLPTEVEGIGEQYRFYIEILRAGGTAYISEFFPLALRDQPELTLLLGFSVFWLVGIAGFVGLSLRRPVPAVALLLVVLGFGMTVDTNVRAIGTAVVFLILSAGLLVVSRGLRRQNWRLRDGVAGAAIGAIGGLLALALLLTTPSAVAQPWQNWRTWDPFRQGGSVYTFNWLQNYPRLLNPGNNVPIMTVESDSPSYWRANALDTFTGSAWVASQAFLKRLDLTRSGSEYVFAVPAFDPTPAGEKVEEVFTLRSVYTNYLFVGGDPETITMTANAALRVNDMRSIHVSRALGPILSYEVTAVIPELKPESLIGKGAAYPDDVERYLSLPFPKPSELEGSDKDAAWRSLLADAGIEDREWEGLYLLNSEIVGEAVDPYDKTLRVEKYLRRFFEYSLSPPASSLSSPYAAFLFETRSGYCQHFAGAMALLLRYNGIPARVAVGFTTGEPQGDSYTVSTNNAHAWVEVYFPEVGWVAFDPTPGRSLPTAGASSTTPGFVNPFVDDTPTNGGSVTPTLPRSQFPDEDIGQGGGTERSSWMGSSWLPWVLVGVFLLVCWPLGRRVWRSRELHKGSLEERLQASLQLLRGHLADYGARISPALTTDETIVAVENLLRVQPDSGFSERVEAVLFGGRAATQEDLDGAETLRRQVKTRLRRKYGWVRTGLTWYGVPRRIPAQGGPT